MELIDEKKRLPTGKMKGTEVPNPRRSSACDCTRVLTIELITVLGTIVS